MTNSDLKRRIRSFEQLFIEHPRIVDAELAIMDLQLRQAAYSDLDNEILCTQTTSADTYNFSKSQSSLEDEENHLTQYCVIVVGEPGAGKTRLKDHIKGKPEFKQDLTGVDGDIIPLLAYDMPDKPTPKSFIAELCDIAGIALPSKITRNELASKLRKQLKQIGTRLIMIDEAHTLVEGRKDEAVLEAARCLKFLLNTCGVPIVLLGEEPLARLTASKALKRRIDSHICIDPYSWSYEDDRFEFLSNLDQLDEALMFETLCRFAENEDLASRLYFVSGGHIGLVAKYLAKSLKIALRNGDNSIDEKILAKAYREINPIKRSVSPDPDCILDIPADSDNPFLVDRGEFKQMWAVKYVVPTQTDVVQDKDKSDVVKKLRRPKKTANSFVNG